MPSLAIKVAALSKALLLAVYLVLWPGPRSAPTAMTDIITAAIHTATAGVHTAIAPTGIAVTLMGTVMAGLSVMAIGPITIEL